MLGFVTFAFVACKKEDLVKNNTVEPQNTQDNVSQVSQRGLDVCVGINNVSAVNGILRFSSVADFQNTARGIQLRHDSLCNGDSLDFFRVSKCFENNFNYTSLRSIIFTSHLNALSNEIYDIENDLDNKYFPHIGVRTVCNAQGEVFVGNELQVYTAYGDIFIIHNGNTNYTNDIISKEYKNLRNVSRYKMDGSELYYDNLGNESLKSAPKNCKTWLHINNKYYNNGRRMIRLSNFSLNSPNLVSSGSETWVYRKVGPTWVLAWVNGLNVNYGGNFQNKNCDHMAFISGGISGNNAHHRRRANDQWTPNGFAMNIARRVSNGTFGGNAWHASQSGNLNITVH